jgi:hypothetical protein
MSVLRFAGSLLFTALLIFSSGCKLDNNKDDDKGRKQDPQEEAWISQFKTELSRTEQRFFEGRYIQTKDDPFYVKDVTRQLSPDKPVTREVADQIDFRKEDFNESFPLLTEQLERTQLIFAVTAVVPAYKATLALNAASGQPDLEALGRFMKFKALVEGKAVFNDKTGRLEISPEVRDEAAKLAGELAERSLKSIAQALGSTTVSLPAALRTELKTYVEQLETLNPVASGRPGDPMVVWGELKGVYDRIFGALTEIAGLAKFDEKLSTTRSPKLRKRLEAQMLAENGKIKPALDLIAELQKHETRLLENLISLTEKQFRTAKLVTRLN